MKAFLCLLILAVPVMGQRPAVGEYQQDSGGVVRDARGHPAKVFSVDDIPDHDMEGRPLFHDAHAKRCFFFFMINRACRPAPQPAPAAPQIVQPPQTDPALLQLIQSLIATLNNRQAPQTDPVLLQLLQQLLAQKQPAPTVPAPAASHLLIVLGQQGQPYVLPINPNPPYSVPINPNPPYVIPVQPNPPYVVPINPNPPYVMPINPNPPYTLPVQPKPPFTLPVNPNPPGVVPIQPSPGGTLPIQPMPGTAPVSGGGNPSSLPPTGYQTYSRVTKAIWK